MSTRRMLSVLIENKPGVFTQIAVPFVRRAFSIYSLTVGETKGPCISRMTVVVGAAKLPVKRVIRQLNKFVNVLEIIESGPAAAVEHQPLLVKVSTDDSSRTNVLQIVNLFRARVIDVIPDAMTVKAAGPGAKVETFLTTLEPYGIWEIVQSGAVAIARDTRLPSERAAAELN